MTTQPTVVLVHGALTDASVWHPVLARLQARHIPAVAPALPMASLDGDIAAVRSLRETIEVPVAHPDVVTDTIPAAVSSVVQSAKQVPA